MKNYTEIAVVVDRSGSMHGLEKDTIGGYNSFLKDQQAHPGEAKFTLVQFDDKYEKVMESVPLGEVKMAEEGAFAPRGATALFDAIGKTINDMGNRFVKLPESERPAKVLVAIITDGYENFSREFKRKEQIACMIKEQTEKWGWEFFFIAANQDAFVEGASFNIPQANAINFTHDSAGVRSAYAGVSGQMVSHRTK